MDTKERGETNRITAVPDCRQARAVRVIQATRSVDIPGQKHRNTGCPEGRRGRTGDIVGAEPQSRFAGQEKLLEKKYSPPNTPFTPNEEGPFPAGTEAPL